MTVIGHVADMCQRRESYERLVLKVVVVGLHIRHVGAEKHAAPQQPPEGRHGGDVGVPAVRTYPDERTRRRQARGGRQDFARVDWTRDHDDHPRLAVLDQALGDDIRLQGQGQ